MRSPTEQNPVSPNANALHRFLKARVSVPASNVETHELPGSQTINRRGSLQAIPEGLSICPSSRPVSVRDDIWPPSESNRCTLGPPRSKTARRPSESTSTSQIPSKTSWEAPVSLPSSKMVSNTSPSNDEGISGDGPEHAPRKPRNTKPRLPDIDQAFIDREASPE